MLTLFAAASILSFAIYGFFPIYNRKTPVVNKSQEFSKNPNALEFEKVDFMFAASID